MSWELLWEIYSGSLGSLLPPPWGLRVGVGGLCAENTRRSAEKGDWALEGPRSDTCKLNDLIWTLLLLPLFWGSGMREELDTGHRTQHP